MLSDDAMISLLLVAGAVGIAFGILAELGVELDWDDATRRGFEVGPGDSSRPQNVDD